MTLHPFHYSNNLNFNTYYFSPNFPTTPLPPLPHKPRRWPHMATGPTSDPRRKDKVLVILGATGAGKSRLSLDLATLFPCIFEIVNSDKIQLHRGLDITTNKLPLQERRGVAHHLLGEFDPGGDFTPADFRAVAGQAISSITNRRKVPMLVGGSNSFIHALVVDRFEPGSNVFEPGFNVSVSSELRYNCCFLWVDVSLAVLEEYLSKRVDEMLDSGMLEELAEFCDPDRQDGHGDSSAIPTGLRKAIGVPEFTQYFKKYPPKRGGDDDGDDRERRGAYEEAVTAIKDNTCQLAKTQIGKILRLRGGGWDLKRLDATDAFRAVVATRSSEDDDGKRWSEIWERQVVEPSMKIVKRFLEE